MKHGKKKYSTNPASMRKQARRVMEKKGVVKKGDGKDVDHKKPLHSGGSNKTSNLRILSAKKNRSAGGKIGGKLVTGRKKQDAGRKGGKKSSRKGIRNK